MEMVESGDDSVSRLVFGESRDVIEEGQLKTHNTIWRQGTVLTAVHEYAHGKLRRALDTGALNRGQLLFFFRNLDSVLEGKSANLYGKGGQVSGKRELRFLRTNEELEALAEKNGTSLEIEADKMLDEAVAEWMESDVLGTRKGVSSHLNHAIKESFRAMAAISEGDVALGQGLSGAALVSKLKAFSRGVKRFFEVALKRNLLIKKGIRDGVISEADVESFRAKLMGTHLEEEHQQRVQELYKKEFGKYETDAILDAPSFSLGNSHFKGEQIDNLIQSARSGGDSKARSVFSLSKLALKRFQEAGFIAEGVNLEGWNLAFSGDLIRKNDKLNANKQFLERESLIPLLDEDYRALPLLFESPDKIERGQPRRGNKNVMKLTKVFDNELVAEALVSLRKNRITVERFTKKSRNRGSMSDFNENLPEHTSETIPVTDNNKHLKNFNSKLNSNNGQNKGGSSFSVERVTSAMDSDYMKAVEIGDMEAAQKMVDEAARRAGYDSPKLYHGTDKPFDIFEHDADKTYPDVSSDEWFYFTTDKETADFYADNPDSQKIDKGVLKRVISAYLKTKNVKHIQKEDFSFGRFDFPHDAESIIDQKLELIMSDYDIEDTDTIHVKDPDEGGKIDIWMARDSNNIKSADPVTYDSDGKVIPLSKRFNEADDRISFSLGSGVRPRMVFDKVEARSIAKTEIVGRELVNKDSGMMAILSNTNVEKLLSGKALAKSDDNEAHAFGVANIDYLYERAVYEGFEEDDKQREQVKGFSKFKVPFVHNGVIKIAHLTNKELEQHGNKIYSIEIQKIEKLERVLGEQYNTDTPTIQSSFNDKLRSKVEELKENLQSDKGNDQGDMGDTSFSLGRSEMVDALNKSIYERVKDPELKAAALFETASKLEELRRDRDEIKSLFGKKVNVRALRDPIKKSELMKQYRVMRDSLMQDYVNTALEEHDFITEKLDEEFPLSELKEAKAAIREAEKRARNEAKEWLDSEWEKVKKDNSPLKKVQRNLEMLDAILIALPTHLRGKIKGVKTLSKMSNDEKALEYLQEKINEAGDLLENDAIKQDLQKQFDEKLMELPTHLRGKIRGAKTLASIYIFGDR